MNLIIQQFPPTQIIWMTDRGCLLLGCLDDRMTTRCADAGTKKWIEI